FGGRYIPQLSYIIEFEKARKIDFEAAVNLYGNLSFQPFDTLDVDGNIKAYRLWGRYTGEQFELRTGLQKIDFGTAFLLRPLQWFDEVDPRDPLKFTTGVYGALGRYYFLNNANIWAWVLFGNENPRGFEVMKTNTSFPEFGGRIQYPSPKGEIALTYHHRTANSEELMVVPSFEEIPENRIGIDGKWDVKVGLWIEASYIHKSQNVGILTNQSFCTFGMDYTFGIGNGLNVIAEHMISTMNEDAFQFTNSANISASMLSYPIGFFDNITGSLFYAWSNQAFSYFLNYEHQFKKITGYLMAYYNPESTQYNLGSDFSNNFSGPGFRIMLVYNH
ncbi:MAG: hypothetical protein Q8T08_24615, partial [Ignavibacteria bacterium]|nr:hypothetical protein [Ignavibacteria bacterium]